MRLVLEDFRSTIEKECIDPIEEQIDKIAQDEFLAPIGNQTMDLWENKWLATAKEVELRLEDVGLFLLADSVSKLITARKK